MTTSEKLTPWLIGLGLGLLVLIVMGGTIFLALFNNRIYPGINIDEIMVGGLTQAEAKQLLDQRLAKPDEYPVTIMVDEIRVSSSSAELSLAREYDSALTQAFEVGRVGFPLTRLWVLLETALKPKSFNTRLTYDTSAVLNLVQKLKTRVDLPGATPAATLTHSSVVSALNINPGEMGRELQVEETVWLVLSQAGKETPVAAKVASISSVLNPDEVKAARERASQLVGKRIILKADNVRLELNDQKLVALLAFPQGYKENGINSLLDTWQDVVARPAQSASFVYDPETLIVSEFVPDRPGLELDRAQTKELLISETEQVINQENQGQAVGIYNQADIALDLPVITTQPKTSLADTNDLGIKELIGWGESEYDHSIANRIHNVALTTNRISNTLVPPGKEFSFNKALGKVSAQTGFRSAYVIKKGRTELGDGGGVCQVSTTIFRAALDAGLKITRRLPHSYRVSYYELNSKPGIDATVYAGNTDLRFINNTNHYILLHGEADSENLYMKIEIYGASDGRTTEIKNHEVWGYTPAPPAEYYPDPTLPVGTTKQIDWAVGGAKAKFTHLIKNAAGEVVSEKTYYSNYQPWAAKYLVGG